MKIRDIVAIVAVALAAGGCNQNDEGLRQEGRVPILLRASVDDAAKGLTRAATAKTTQSVELLQGETVDVYIKKTSDDSFFDSGTQPLTCLVSNASGDLTPSDAATVTRYYPSDGNPIKMYAVHPHYTSNTPFSVKTDQTEDGDYAESDLCYSSADTYSRQSGAQTLWFNHALSKIVVNITTNTGKALPTTVKLLAKKTTLMTWTWTDGSDFAVPAEAMGDPTTITMGMTSNGPDGVSGGAVIPPQTIAAGAAFISFTVTGLGPMIYPLPATTTFASGKRYTYKIKVNDVGIDVSTNVSDWGTKVNGGTVLGKTFKEIGMNPLWYVAEGNMTSATVMTVGNAGYYFTWPTAMTNFAAQSDSYSDYKTAGKSISGINGVKWHFPVLAEWWSIVPVKGDQVNLFSYVSSSSTRAYKEDYISPIFGYNDETRQGYSETSYWIYVSASEIRAIRFIGSNYCSAWKYELVGPWTSGSTSYLRISATLIDYIEKSETDASTWYTNKWNTVPWRNDESVFAVQRDFYARGIHDAANSDTPTKGSGVDAQFLSATEAGTNTVWALWAKSGTIQFSNGPTKPVGRNVRLFRDN